MRLGDKRKLDKAVIPKNWLEGWVDGVTNSTPSGLEYSSISGYYHLNEARRIAYDAGYAAGQKEFEKAVRLREEGEPNFNLRRGVPEPPGEVVAACYGSVSIAA